MELIDRYLYAVTKELPNEKREEIEAEVRALIYDLLDARKNKTTNQKATTIEVLQELGPPEKLASKYTDHEQFIIGPRLYHKYIQFLKVSFITILTVMIASFIVNTILNPLQLLPHFVQLITSLFITVIPMAIGWTTLLFMFVQYIQSRNKHKTTTVKEWDPNKLPAVPNKESKIKRKNALIAIGIYIFAIIFFAFSHQYFGIWLFEDGEFIGAVSFLNETSIQSTLFFIILLFSLFVLKEIIKIIYEAWTPSLATIITTINIAAIGILLWIKNQLWNDQFIQTLVDYRFFEYGSDAYQTVSYLWGNLTFWIVVLTILGLMIDILLSFRRSSV